MNILIIDGQGGRVGRQLVEAVRQNLPAARVTAVGTNAMATQTMLKAGPHQCATGENAVIVCSRSADLIVGPIGLVIADALLGEITPAMALAVGQCSATKQLFPVSHFNNVVVGAQSLSLSRMMDEGVELLRSML